MPVIGVATVFDAVINAAASVKMPDFSKSSALNSVKG